jgi:hypothetical protein
MYYTLLPASYNPVTKIFMGDFEAVYAEKNENIKQATTSERFLYFIKSGCISTYLESSSNLVFVDFFLDCFLPGHYATKP